MIHVYDIGNTNYTGNGNAVLQPTECRLRNIAGGNYDLTMTHPIDPEGKWKHLVPGAIIKAPVPREEIENAYAGYEADVYKTTAQAELRESASEPTAIIYPAWNPNNQYQVGSKVRVSTWSHKNYQCTYYDETSPQVQVPPYNSAWWRPIADQTSGAPVLVTLPAGTDLYFVEDYDTNWYKMSTYYGVVGYIKKDKVQYDRHLTPSETKPRIITEQLFRIEQPTVDTKSRAVTVTAKHVSYDLAGILIKDVSLAQASPAMALGRITEGFMMDYAGTIATDMQTEDYGTYTGDIKGKNGIFALLDPDKGIVSTFNAAYKRDNWDLFVLTKNTVDRGYRLKYRKNMLGVNWAQDSSGLVTRVVPVAKDENGGDLYLPEKWIDSSRIGDYPVIKMERLTVKGQVGKDKGTGDGSTWTEADLLTEMRTKAGERYSVDEADKVNVTVTVDFEQLGDAEEHKDLQGMETVLLYDTVTVINDEIGLEIQLYVSEWEWDAIRKKITALKLVNTTDYRKGTVTGYNVQAKSIGSEKLTDDVAGDIMQQVVDIIPEYADPSASRPATVTVVDSDPTLAWGTRSKVGSVQGTDLHVTMPGNPASEKVNRAGDTMTGDLAIAKYANEYVVVRVHNLVNGITADLMIDSDKITHGIYSLGYSPDGEQYVRDPKWMIYRNAAGNVIVNGKAAEADSVAWDNITGKPGSFYTLPLAANGTRGGVKIGYTQSGKNYPVQLDNEKMYVYVPWTDSANENKVDGISGATVTRYGACATAAGTRNKAVSITSGTFSLEAGAIVVVNFNNANTANNPRLNVNSTGAKSIYHNGALIGTGPELRLLRGVRAFVYDGTYWNLLGDSNHIVYTDIPVTTDTNGFANLALSTTLPIVCIGAPGAQCLVFDGGGSTWYVKALNPADMTPLTGRSLTIHVWYIP